ncbi:MAG: hypothetical protein HXX11_06710 [Desulfuromonadales bacterium]|nr:hypothetical protein [Desulfuromonadales bacterium]
MVAGQFVGLLPGDADGLQIGQDFVEVGGVVEKTQGFFLFFLGRFRLGLFLMLWFPPFNQEQQPPDVFLYQFVRDTEYFGAGLGEPGSGAGGVTATPSHTHSGRKSILVHWPAMLAEKHACELFRIRVGSKPVGVCRLGGQEQRICRRIRTVWTMTTSETKFRNRS